MIVFLSLLLLSYNLGTFKLVKYNFLSDRVPIVFNQMQQIVFAKRLKNTDDGQKFSFIMTENHHLSWLKKPC